MNARELVRMQSVFDAALERPSGERDAFVDDACGGDEALRDQVLRLLRAGGEATAGGFVESAVRAAALSFAGPGDQSGRLLGPYRLLRELGHGGMGTVWHAERADTAYRAEVAIKLVRGGFANAELARHFRHERQILADLRHPHVAALLDGGEAPDGTPYLVMEYIDGQPITTWAAERRLPLVERLRLFRLVCDAVQHAHASLVVHRDIKPSNILVGADGVPKLLDFGIARLLASDAPTETTALARRLTPSYASPEQIRGERVTVATDVFSLGVLLYELVTGVHPFVNDDTTTEEVRRRVLEVEPMRASDALRQRGPAGPVSARAVAGDLDNIIAKAMRKEPELRYVSVAQLSEDIGRMLAGEPVLARPTSLGYRARKFMKRHTTGVAAATLVLLALVGGLATTLWQARRADRARARAEAALAQATEVQNFLTGIFNANAPDQSLGAQITARQLLDRGARRIDSLTGQPALQAYLLETIGKLEFMLGEYRTAKNMYDRELTILRALPNPVDTLLVDVLNSRGQAYDNLGFPDSAAAAFEDAIATGTKYFGDENERVLAELNNIGGVYFRLGRDRESEAAYRHVIAVERRILAPDDINRSATLCNLGLHLAIQGRYGESEPLFGECLHIRLLHDSLQRRPSTASALGNFGAMLREASRYDEAEPYLRRALAVYVKTLGPRHLVTAGLYVSYGTLLAKRGRGDDFTRADSLLHAALDIRRILGPTHPALAYPLHSLGILALNRGDPRAAEGWLRQALAIRRHGGDAPRETARTLVRLAQARLAAGDTPVETILREADSLARARIEPDDPVRSRAAIGLALAEVRRGDRADGGPLYARSMEALADRIGQTHPFLREACAAGAALGLDAGGACSTAP
jgi:tetratricopeptide (TPR) repeat protein